MREITYIYLNYYTDIQKLCHSNIIFPKHIHNVYITVYPTYRGGDPISSLPKHITCITIKSEYISKIKKINLPNNLTSLILINVILENMLPKKIGLLNITLNDKSLTNELILNLSKFNYVEILTFKNTSMQNIFLSLPKKLKIFTSCQSNIKKILKLPDNIEELNVNKNKLKYLPKLPTTLRKINCIGNNLCRLPKLPTRLSLLNCSHNILTKIPKLNARLKHLNCSYNLIRVLPQLNKNLEVLRFGENPIKICPYFPESLKDIGFSCSLPNHISFSYVLNIPKDVLCMSILNNNLKYKPYYKKSTLRRINIGYSTCKYRNCDYLVKKIQRFYKAYRLKKIRNMFNIHRCTFPLISYYTYGY